jgi:hypothetical protein
VELPNVDPQHVAVPIRAQNSFSATCHSTALSARRISSTAVASYGPYEGGILARHMGKVIVTEVHNLVRVTLCLDTATGKVARSPQWCD